MVFFLQRINRATLSAGIVRPSCSSNAVASGFRLFFGIPVFVWKSVTSRKKTGCRQRAFWGEDLDNVSINGAGRDGTVVDWRERIPAKHGEFFPFPPLTAHWFATCFLMRINPLGLSNGWFDSTQGVGTVLQWGISLLPRQKNATSREVAFLFFTGFQYGVQPLFSAAWAAASRATGTRNGEQLT